MLFHVKCWNAQLFVLLTHRTYLQCRCGAHLGSRHLVSGGREGAEGEVQAQLHSQVQARLGHVRPYLKPNPNQSMKKSRAPGQAL